QIVRKFNAARLSAVPDSTVDDTGICSHGGLQSGSVALGRRSLKPQPCRWCGREVADVGLGRRRQYCRQSCRQRAYEQRAMVKGTSLAPDSVVLTADEAAELSDRVYQVRCAAEDVAIAIEEGAKSA